VWPPSISHETEEIHFAKLFTMFPPFQRSLLVVKVFQDLGFIIKDTPRLAAGTLPTCLRRQVGFAQ
jgi:hypothetical protein